MMLYKTKAFMKTKNEKNYLDFKINDWTIMT